jgi:hypothetical protein
MPPPELRAFDYGKPVVGYSFSDRKVAILTARFLGAAGRVVILTANWRRRDRDGLRQILEDEFASILGDQFVKTCGLLVIAKRGKADLDMFIDAFCSCIRAHSWAAGYETALLP